MKCFEKVAIGDQDELLSKFRQFGTKNEQDAFLQSLIRVLPIKRRKQNPITGVHRDHSFEYLVSSSSGVTKVCKKAFISFFAVTDDRIRRLCNLLVAGKSPIDKRGQGISGNAIPGAVVKLIEEHINSFPVREAHYTGRTFRYLSEKLDVKTMHMLFTEKYPDQNCNYYFYLKIFRERFQLSFGRPQVDTCCLCESLDIKIKSKSLNETAKRTAMAEKEVHKRRAKKFHSKMREIKELCSQDDSHSAICMDFMQNLMLPNIPVQEVFYLHQLTVNVFEIHDLHSGNAMFYVNHEGKSKKGCNDVCSFIMHYLDTVLPKTTKHLHIFSDGCAGQNKNHTLIRLCAALVTLGRFATINQYFPIRGHSFLPCDRDFAVVKRKMKKTDRIYTIMDYVQLIANSSKQQKFSICVVDSSMVIDYKSWWPTYYKKNCLSTDSYGRAVPRDKKKSFTIASFMHFTHNSRKPGYVAARDFIDSVDYEFQLSTTKTKPVLPGQKAYPEGRIPINVKKMRDVQKLRPYLPDDDVVQSFYVELFDWPVVDKDDLQD